MYNLFTKLKKLHLVHLVGFGTNPIGGSSPVANKILTLTDGEAAQTPQVMVPSTVLCE